MSNVKQDFKDIYNLLVNDGPYNSHDVRAKYWNVLGELEKREPKEVKEAPDGKMFCPNVKCNRYIHKYADLVLYRYCPWCGQALDWTKEKEKMYEKRLD